MSDFYRAFEEKYRGSRQTILNRLYQYWPFIEPLVANSADVRALDLGCGRGEWLEFMTASGITAEGVDLDQGMLSAAQELGLNAVYGDAIAYIENMSDDSVDIVSAFHLVEHLPFELVQKVLSESMRVLRPGGIIILETPNPENLVVSSTSFYLDPTHNKPIPPLLLEFLANFCGFETTSVVRLQEPVGLKSKTNVSVRDVLSGVSPDFSIVAQKPGSPERNEALGPAFSMEFGLTLAALSERYEARIAKQARDNQAQLDELFSDMEELKLRHDALYRDVYFYAELGAIGRIFYHPNGRPVRWLRQLFFHSNGKPRGAFRKYVLRPSGKPKRLFRHWLQSFEYYGFSEGVRWTEKPPRKSARDGVDEKTLTPHTSSIQLGLTEPLKK